MRNIMLAVAVAVAALAAATPSRAGSEEKNDQPQCFVKQLLGYDSYGNLITKHVRVCR